MRGIDHQQTVMYCYFNIEKDIPANHPLRRIRTIMDKALRELSSAFNGMYARTGRSSIPPERLLRALLLQVLHSIRSERLLMEQLKFNLQYRWFVGLNPDEEVWDASVYTKNRNRLMRRGTSELLLAAIMKQAQEANLLSAEHFTVDGTMIQAWAHRRSFSPKDPKKVVGTGARGRKLLRDTHESKTDPDARLYSKGGPALPSYLGHVITENRMGLVVAACATLSSKTAEEEAGLKMLAGIKKTREEKGSEWINITLGADKAYQTKKFIEGLRDHKVSPHVAEYAPNPKWPNWLNEQERQHFGFSISQKKRKLVEKVFGWAKQGRAVKQTKLRGLARVDWMFRLNMVAHNLVRMGKLLAQPVPIPAQ